MNLCCVTLGFGESGDPSCIIMQIWARIEVSNVMVTILFKISLRSSGLVFFKYALIYFYQITLKYIGIFNFLAFLTSFLKKITW